MATTCILIIRQNQSNFFSLKKKKRKENPGQAKIFLYRLLKGHKDTYEIRPHLGSARIN